MSEHIHILMGTFNGARWLPEQLSSYVKQSHKEWSLWVSDDGSTDTTWAILKQFSAQHPGRVRILKGPQKGSAANYLHLLCHPDLPPGIVALSDQDDVWMPDRLARSVKQLCAAGSGPCVWSGRYLISDMNLKRSRVSNRWSRGPSLENALVQNILAGHTLTLNPAAVEIVREAGIQSVSNHDWWIYQLIMATGGQVLMDTKAILHYRQHGENLIGARTLWGGKIARLNRFTKGQMRDWMEENLAALAAADALLTEKASAFVCRWPRASRLEKIRLLSDFGVHRQSRLETVLIYLGTALGRL